MTDATSSARLPAWPLRKIWPRHTAKRMARHFRRSPGRMVKWLRDGVPGTQRAELADVIDGELDRIDEEIAALRSYRDWLRLGSRG